MLIAHDYPVAKESGAKRRLALFNLFRFLTSMPLNTHERTPKGSVHRFPTLAAG